MYLQAEDQDSHITVRVVDVQCGHDLRVTAPKERKKKGTGWGGNYVLFDEFGHEHWKDVLPRRHTSHQRTSALISTLFLLIMIVIHFLCSAHIL